MEREKMSNSTTAEQNWLDSWSVMVWADISNDGFKHLYVIRNGSLTGVPYRDDIHAHIVRPYSGVIW